jgi:hypothetical protein
VSVLRSSTFTRSARSHCAFSSSEIHRYRCEFVVYSRSITGKGSPSAFSTTPSPSRSSQPASRSTRRARSRSCGSPSGLRYPGIEPGGMNVVATGSPSRVARSTIVVFSTLIVNACRTRRSANGLGRPSLKVGRQLKL